MTIETFMLWLLSLIVAAAIGYCLVSLFWPPTVSRGLMWMFAPGMGLGVCSLIFVIFRRPMFTVEFAVLVLLVANEAKQPRHFSVAHAGHAFGYTLPARSVATFVWKPDAVQQD